MTLRSLLKRVRVDAGRLRAAAERRLKAPPKQTLQRPATKPASRPRGSADLAALYPCLPGPALKAAVEASVAGEEVSEYGLTRFAMYAALADRLAAHDGLRTTCLSISGSKRLARILGLRAARLVEAAYPEHTMLALDFPDASFDACVSDQVLEHVEGNPFDAVKESFRVVAPGGFVVHTTCVLNPVHREPGDFWRFTPDALALLCRAAGAEVVEAGSWGNRVALTLTQLGIRSLRIPTDPKHPLHRIAVTNDPDWPIHTWVIARKHS